MKKMVKGRTLGRSSSHKKALFRNLLNALIKYGRIETTTAKAKELRPYAEKVITRAKVDNAHNRAIAAKYLSEKAALVKLFKEIGPKYQSQKGGYLRILKKGVRLSDSAAISLIEFV